MLFSYKIVTDKLTSEGTIEADSAKAAEAAIKDAHGRYSDENGNLKATKVKSLEVEEIKPTHQLAV